MTRVVTAGNVALMKLGMSDDDYTYLSTDTDFIVHAAANVNLAYPYSVSTLHGWLTGSLAGHIHFI